MPGIEPGPLGEKQECYLCAMLYRSLKVQLHLYLECHCNRVTLFQLIRFLHGTFFLRQLCRFLRSRSRVKFWTASICQDELPFKFCQQLLDFCQLISFCSRHLFWLLKKKFVSSRNVWLLISCVRLRWAAMFFLLAIPGLFFFIFVFSELQLTNICIEINEKLWRWWDSNHGSLMSEVTALPTAPQTRPKLGSDG